MAGQFRDELFLIIEVAPPAFSYALTSQGGMIRDPVFSPFGSRQTIVEVYAVLGCTVPPSAGQVLGRNLNCSESCAGIRWPGDRCIAGLRVAYVRFGSFATEADDVKGPCTSAPARKRTNGQTSR
jgi:hypothetical protein